ncbi:MAG: DUF3179 domain-containing protein [Chloroflexi bacterium]|nr:DUF3179 domain-containing protein [Chloroflexota bacterium]
MYSARINGNATTFGTSGLLYRSNKVMYDRETNTLWSQLLGEPIVGPLVGSGVKLEFFPVALTTWGEWLQEHPDTVVMSLETGVYRPSQYEPENDERSIYYGYRARAEPLFPVWDRDDRLDAKDEVLGLSIDGEHRAYPISTIQQRRLVPDSLNGVQLVVLGSALSSEARAYRTRGTEFSLPDNVTDAFPRVLLDGNGEEWTVTDSSLIKVSDSETTRSAVPANVSFWFGWRAFHSDTDVYAP